MTQFTNLPDYCAYPAFSPDGKNVVFQRAVDGKHERQLTRDTQTSDEYPSYSHDGNRIVFSHASDFYGGRRGENTWNSFDVYTINADGTNLQRITHLNSKGVIRPRFSPDGRTILFERTYSSNTSIQNHICQINATGGGTIHEVLRFGQDDGDVCFLNDGQQIVFVSNNGGGCDLWRVALDGGKPVRITDTGDSWGKPCLTPDGKSVVFRGGSFPNIGIHQIDLDGTHPRILAGQSLTDDPLHWKP